MAWIYKVDQSYKLGDAAYVSVSYYDESDTETVVHTAGFSYATPNSTATEAIDDVKAEGQRERDTRIASENISATIAVNDTDYI